MRDKIINSIITRLGIEYRKDRNVVEDLYNDYSQIASDVSNRAKNDEKLLPYIKKAVVEAYLLIGSECEKSTNYGSMTTSYVDIEEKLVNDVKSIRILK